VLLSTARGQKLAPQKMLSDNGRGFDPNRASESHESRNNELRRPTGRRLISYDVYCSHRYFIPVLVRVWSNGERPKPNSKYRTKDPYCR